MTSAKCGCAAKPATSSMQTTGVRTTCINAATRSNNLPSGVSRPWPLPGVAQGWQGGDMTNMCGAARVQMPCHQSCSMLAISATGASSQSTASSSVFVDTGCKSGFYGLQRREKVVLHFQHPTGANRDPQCGKKPGSLRPACKATTEQLRNLNSFVFLKYNVSSQESRPSRSVQHYHLISNPNPSPKGSKRLTKCWPSVFQSAYVTLSTARR